MSDQEVVIKKTMLVHPASHPAACSTVLQLSNLDRKCPALMYLVFLYSRPQASPRKHVSDIFGELREDLEETLSAWYPAAGRLCVDPGSGRLNVDCCNAGALWAEAATKTHVSDLGDLSQDNHRFLQKLVFMPQFLAEAPLVVVQVTEFGCGGYAVGVGTNHALFDGTANFDFMTAWASRTAARGEGTQLKLESPMHERGRFLVDHRHGENHEETAIRVIAFDHLYRLIKQAEFKMISGGRDQEDQEFVLGTFTVGSELIGRLKGMVDGGSCTSFEVVAAHLWKARTKAIEVPRDRTVCLQFSVDTRSRLHPPLPKSFTGNAYVLSSVSSTCGDLLQETLASIVHKIKEAKNAVTDDYVRAYLLALEGPQFALPALPELTVVSDWRHTPYHRVNFGVGDTVCAVPLAAPLPGVVYFMKNPREVGGIDVRIGMMRKRLVAFRRYFLEML